MQKRTYYKQRLQRSLTGVLLLLLLASSCKKFVDIDLPGKNLLAPYVLENNSSLVAALNGVYSAMADPSGDLFIKPALFADELSASADLLSSQNTYSPTDAVPYRFFADYYKVVYNANYLLQGLETASTMLSPDTIKLVKGECYFLRAFSYFQLTNFYGMPPLVLTTNHNVAAFAPNSTEDALYAQIIADLKLAAGLLPNGYPEAAAAPVKRVRVNKQAVHTLLAKVYLYRKDWTNAIAMADSVLAVDSLYGLAGSIGAIFDPASKETIWQVFNQTGVTPIAAQLVPSSATVVPSITVRDEMVTAFDTSNDLRYKAWVKIQSLTTPAPAKYFYANKYKVRTAGAGTEYLVQFRLADIVLTKAEALARNNKLSDAVTELEKIRTRAGLLNPLPSDISSGALLDTIALERKRELAFEAGNRWFDLKRTGKALAVLQPIKPDFEEYRALLPYSAGASSTVIGVNPNMKQNDGYK
ncbi:MAG: RagB/SusD family nutrient uptake outer membrane protein [Candidatus Pseudobacter hemicellulosilyticus]|uniref:RagB/SusD family nutrient uptake outer membrane protein n=1 Tax=Candidatus Pseudobacter hemicellulosilyticus TaxID=3121375 RepID=A0AAJ5WPB4_9BACT|nr:MAG: RagB/SusD family nutrient uptake outer membrane protein [Pseudobacter sp.]